MIDVVPPRDPKLASYLARHPGVRLTDEPPRDGLCFRQGPWERWAWSGRPDVRPFGLVELMDNNPLVCADQASAPDAAGTLALIALGPAIKAGLLAAAPALITNAPVDSGLLEQALASENWTGGAVLSAEERDLGSVYALTALIEVRDVEDPAEIEGLYEECFGRSFFVRRVEEWHTGLVAGQPHAVYRLALTDEGDPALLRVQAMADRDGKCGAAQLVHLMNVMAGFEESSGLS